ncbi:MAG TPA: sigma-70 family RNA polymerase sigma factor [Terriglobales bacterium]
MRTDTQAEKLNSGAELITRAQEGDSHAFAALFATHKPRIYAICLRMTNNMAEAEDLTQDAFIHVFRKLSTFRGESAFSTWLYRIAVNTVLMHFRKKSNRQVSLDQPAQRDSNLPKREYGRVDDRLVGSVDRLALARAINELPPGYRTIFLMHEVQGYEHQEIARLLHCSIGNSKSQLHKAKLRMRRLLSPDNRTHQYAEARMARAAARELHAPAPAKARTDAFSEAEGVKVMRDLKKIQSGSSKKDYVVYQRPAGRSRKSIDETMDADIALSAVRQDAPVFVGSAS